MARKKVVDPQALAAKLSGGEPIKAVWGDAWGGAGWRPIDSFDEEPEALTVVSVGTYVKTGSDGILVAGDIASNGDVNSYSFIPFGMLKSLEVLG